jgi:hypothetical protein
MQRSKASAPTEAGCGETDDLSTATAVINSSPARAGGLRRNG